MARPLHKLSSNAPATKAPGKYSDGGGLWLHKREDGGAQWVLRVTVHGRRREMGLGSFPAVTLREAREEAENWRGYIRRCLDPVKERQRERRAAARNLHLLNDIVRDAFESCKAELKGDGKAGRGAGRQIRTSLWYGSDAVPYPAQRRRHSARAAMRLALK